MTTPDEIDRGLLSLMQRQFPLTQEPYADLGQLLGTDADDVMRRIQKLKDQGVVRLIGPVVDPRSLGYQTTLVAVTVAPACLEEAEKVISGHAGVSHGYERDHRFNVWFTLAVPPGVNIDVEAERLVRSSGAETGLSLPAVKVYKIGAYFDTGEMEQEPPLPNGSDLPTRHVGLSDADRAVVNELQQDLPLVPAPFRDMAERAGMDVGRFLAACRLLRQRGVIRRFSASINHRRAGFAANAMACWVCSPKAIDAAGQELASLREVSHCYERKTNAFWPYNLFAMVHCRSRDLCQEVAEAMARQTGLTDFVLLYSTREFKKTRVRYAA